VSECWELEDKDRKTHAVGEIVVYRFISEVCVSVNSNSGTVPICMSRDTGATTILVSRRCTPLVRCITSTPTKCSSVGIR